MSARKKFKIAKKVRTSVFLTHLSSHTVFVDIRSASITAKSGKKQRKTLKVSNLIGKKDIMLMSVKFCRVEEGSRDT